MREEAKRSEDQAKELQNARRLQVSPRLSFDNDISHTESNSIVKIVLSVTIFIVGRSSAAHA